MTARPQAFQPSEASTSDLLHRLGKLIESRPGVIDRPQGGVFDSNARPLEGLEIETLVRVPLRAPRPVDAAFSASLRADNDETDRLMDRAWSSFRQHRNKARYRADCAEIVGREWNTPAERDGKVEQ